MTLVGQTSGAQATITNVRLISDIGAYLKAVSLFQILISYLIQDLRQELRS